MSHRTAAGKSSRATDVAVGARADGRLSGLGLTFRHVSRLLARSGGGARPASPTSGRPKPRR